MATKTAQTTTEETPGTALAAQAPAGLPAELLAEAAEFEGQGTSGAAGDNVVPFLVLLQDMSPETKKRDPKYIDGAEPGKWLNRATGEVYESFNFQPCAFDRLVMEWVPRDNGGGIAGRFPMTHPTPEATMTALGGKQVPDPRDSSGKKMIWRSKEGNDLIDTRYEFGHIIKDDGTIQPAVMGLASTAHTPARAFMTMKRGPTAQMPKPGGGTMIAPAWFRKYRVSSQEKTGNGNSWFIPRFEDYASQGWIGDAHVRAAGKLLYESIKSGALTAANEHPDGDIGGEGAGQTIDNDDQIPI